MCLGKDKPKDRHTHRFLVPASTKSCVCVSCSCHSPGDAAEVTEVCTQYYAGVRWGAVGWRFGPNPPKLRNVKFLKICVACLAEGQSPAERRPRRRHRMTSLRSSTPSAALSCSLVELKGSIRLQSQFNCHKWRCLLTGMARHGWASGPSA